MEEVHALQHLINISHIYYLFIIYHNFISNSDTCLVIFGYLFRDSTDVGSLEATFIHLGKNRMYGGTLPKKEKEKRKERKPPRCLTLRPRVYVSSDSFALFSQLAPSRRNETAST